MFILSLQTLEERASAFKSLLDAMTDFVDWLGEFHDVIYDEVCIAIPQKASDDTIAHHRAKLTVNQRTHRGCPDFRES